MYVLLVDPLEVLRRTNGANAPADLARRGLALAALDEFDDARNTLKQAQAGFEARGDRLSVARCRAAMVEIEVFRRDLEEADSAIGAVEAELEALGDHENAAWMRVVAARAAILLGRGAGALALLESVGADSRLPSDTRAVALLAAGEQALRSRRATLAKELLSGAANLARNPTLCAEIDRGTESMRNPVAEWWQGGECTLVDAVTFETLAAPRIMGGVRNSVIDGLRGSVTVHDGATVSFAARPVLLALMLALGRASPRPVDWHELSKAAFDTQRANDSHRARLKVELGRLRRLLPGALTIASGGAGAWSLASRDQTPIATAIPHPARRSAERALVLLTDGRAWRTAEIAEALGVGTRSAQRDLVALRDRGVVQSIGAGKRTRWHAPGRSETIASQMLLLGTLADT